MFPECSLFAVQVLEPAIELAENGFPVTPITAYHWDKVG
jgi:gamma-glutamyltranspeptidase